jgi:hypothetical protein
MTMAQASVHFKIDKLTLSVCGLLQSRKHSKVRRSPNWPGDAGRDHDRVHGHGGDVPQPGSLSPNRRRRTDRAEGQRHVHAGEDVDVSRVTVRQQRLDQCPGAGGIAKPFAAAAQNASWMA